MQEQSIIMSFVSLFSQWCIPVVMLAIVGIGYVRGVKVYESFVDGAKEGFNIAIMIIPYLVAILFAVGLFDAGGAMNILAVIVRPITNLINMPPAILPLAIIRPLTGGGARGVMVSIFDDYGADSIEGLIASTLQGSTETTFYVLAVYFGCVGIKRIRYAVSACLAGDIIGIISAVLICNAIWGPAGLK